MENIEVVVRASGLHNPQAVTQMKQRLLSEWRSAGAPVVEVEYPTGNALTAALVLTGGTEREVLKILSQLPSPALLIAHGSQNSLPASLEILARIRQDGGEGRILFGPVSEVAKELLREQRIASAWNALRFSRIGLIGEPSEWLVSSGVDRSFLKGKLGIELVDVRIETLIKRTQETKSDRHSVAAFSKRAGETHEASKEDIRGAVSIYLALRSLIDENRLTACTVRCFDLLDSLRNTGCYALSRLNDEKIPSSCEGDLQALFSLLVGSLLTDQIGFMGNIASIDVPKRGVLIAHCTCPLSLSEGYAIRSHFESGIGVGISATLPDGPCTLFRLGGERLDRLFVREGTIHETAPVEGQCRTQATLTMNGDMSELLLSPLGNHHVLLPGHHAATISEFSRRFLRP
ncbi:fucose isomerase [Candidatus Bipolaricaulota bacterium]|nr:fucose isomerase [Candidatus Bipolaricaulota bacterium]